MKDDDFGIDKLKPTFEQEMINYDRTWKTMVCINPLHELIKFDTNQIGDVKCPLCNSPMVVVIKPVFVVEKD